MLYPGATVVSATLVPGGAAQTVPLGYVYTCQPADEATGGVTARLQMMADAAPAGLVSVSFLRIRHLRP